MSSTVAREAQLLIEPAFFWFVIAGGTCLIILAVLRLIEVFSREKMLFRNAEKARKSEKALDELTK